MSLPYGYFLLDFHAIIGFSLTIFVLGFLGIFVFRSNLIITLIFLEVVLFVVNLNFIVFSNYLDDVLGQLYALLVLSVAAANPPSDWLCWWPCSAYGASFPLTT